MPDLNRIVKISRLFKVTTDYLVNDEMELEEEKDLVKYEVEGERAEKEKIRPVSMEEAAAFLRLQDREGIKTALGVLLCICSPVPLILLIGGYETGMIHVSESFATGLGCLLIFLMVAGAVGLFIYSHMNLKNYEYLEKEPIETAYGVDGMVRERKKQYASRHSQLLITGIVLCVLSPTPLFGAMFLFGENNGWAAIMGTVLLLLVVSIGVLCIVRTCMTWGSFQRLLEEGDYSPANKRETRKNGVITSIYWGIVTAL